MPDYEITGSVIVCVTPQRSCRRLIENGAMIALKSGKSMKVLTVFPQKDGASPENSVILEELYEAARMNDATMGVYFNDNPDILAAVIASRENAGLIVTGFPRERSTGFVSKLHELMPGVPIIMIDSDNKEHKILPEKNSKGTA